MKKSIHSGCTKWLQYKNYFSAFSNFIDSAQLQIKLTCPFVGISSGFEFLTVFGGILPFLTDEHIDEAFSTSFEAPYNAHLEKFSLDLGNLPPLIPWHSVHEV